METKLTEVITIPLPETAGRAISSEAEGTILERLEGADALAIGPGLSRDPATVEVVRSVVSKVEVPCVVDADGLNALSVELVASRRGGAPLVLTPHPGEMGRLMGTDASHVQSRREDAAREVAGSAGATVLLKGAGTVCADASGELFLNPTGNVGLATGGTGDVLTGVVAALLARGVPGLEAAAAAAFIHGLAGDMASERIGSTGMVAGDVLDRVPEAFRAIEAAGGGREQRPAQ